MENLFIKGEKYIPEVNFDAERGVLQLSGQSYHEYTDEFYKPVLDWLENYLKTSDRQIRFVFRMTYFNTASSRSILNILLMLEKYQNKNGGVVTVDWYYKKDDYDMMESGEDYQADVENIKINLIEY